MKTANTNKAPPTNTNNVVVVDFKNKKLASHPLLAMFQNIIKAKAA